MRITNNMMINNTSMNINNNKINFPECRGGRAVFRRGVTEKGEL